MRRSVRLSSAVVALAVFVSMTGLWAAGSAEVAKAVRAGNAAAVRALLAKKADVNAPEADGTTALHWAVRANDLATAQLLQIGLSQRLHRNVVSIFGWLAQ